MAQALDQEFPGEEMAPVGEIRQAFTINHCAPMV
jgi:hypothetical protein